HVLAFDHETREWWVAGDREGFDAARDRHVALLDGRRVAADHADPRGSLGLDPRDSASIRGPVLRAFTRDSYCATVSRAIEYILAGDIFEVSLSQRFETEVEASPLALYRRLRAEAPAPFGAYLRFGERAILSA